MAVQQIPGEFPIEIVRGDELNFTVRVVADLTGYTITSGVFDPTSTANPIPDLFSPALTTTVETVTISGQSVTRTNTLVSFVESNTALLDPRRPWRWYMRWVSPGGVTRTFVSGDVRSRIP